MPKGGGFHGTPKKTIFPEELIIYIYIYTLKKNRIQAKNIKKKKMPFQNGGQIVSRHFDFGESLKTTFPNEFFNDIWLIIIQEGDNNK